MEGWTNPLVRGPGPAYSRLEISGIASQFAIQNARFAIQTNAQQNCESP